MIINEVNKDELLNFKYVVDIINEQFEGVKMTDPEFYSNYVFDIVNEQYFVPDEEREPNRIYIVIKFSPAQVDYGQDILPFTIQAVSECNGLVATQRLLLEYAQIFNLNTLVRDGKTIYQTYTTPNVISNFDVVYEGFRSVLVMSGTILLSSNINRITLKYYDGDYALLDYTPTTGWETSGRITAEIGLNNEEVPIDIVGIENSEDVYMWDSEQQKYVKTDGEEIDILNFTENFDSTPDTQPYFENKNFTDTIIKYGTYSFNVVSFLIKNDLNNKILRIKSRRKSINTNFYFKIFYDNGINMPLLKFKLINSTGQQNKGEMPTIALAFTN